MTRSSESSPEARARQYDSRAGRFLVRDPLYGGGQKTESADFACRPPSLAKVGGEPIFPLGHYGVCLVLQGLTYVPGYHP